MSTTADRTIEGRCHCGDVAFALHWPTAPRPLPARACGCGYCLRLGAAWTSAPGGRVDVTLAGADAATRYRFGHGTAEFLVCRTCGIVPVATSAIDDTLYAVVNVNTFEAVAPEEIAITRTDFEGEDETERLARRRRNWTPARLSGA